MGKSPQLLLKDSYHEIRLWGFLYWKKPQTNQNLSQQMSNNILLLNYNICVRKLHIFMNQNLYCIAVLLSCCIKGPGDVSL